MGASTELGSIVAVQVQTYNRVDDPRTTALVKQVDRYD